MVTQKEITKYLRQTERVCPAPYRRKLITELQNNLSELCDVWCKCHTFYVKPSLSRKASQILDFKKSLLYLIKNPLLI